MIKSWEEPNGSVCHVKYILHHQNTPQQQRQIQQPSCSLNKIKYLCFFINVFLLLLLLLFEDHADAIASQWSNCGLKVLITIYYEVIV